MIGRLRQQELCDVLKVPGCNFDATMDLITELDAAVLAQEEQ